MAYDKTTIFQNLGKAVKKHRLVTDPDTGFQKQLDSLMSETAALFNDSASEREILYRFFAAHNSDLQSLDAVLSRNLAVAGAYLSRAVREQIESVGSTAGEVLSDLADAMQEAGDTVRANTISVDGPNADPDNAGNGQLTSLTVTQNARDNNHFDVTCTDSTTEGYEQWRVACSRLGELGIAITGTVFESEEVGVSFLITAQSEISESGDDGDQLDDWQFEGAAKGENTDADGKLYVTLSDSGGTRLVSCYKDAARTELVCEGSREGDGVVTLSEQNNSGLSGSVEVTYSQDDSDVVLTLPFAFAEGDRFRFATTVTSKGHFQYFVVENYGVALPSADAGGETVPESWAE